jgi:hypothetical protein
LAFSDRSQSLRLAIVIGGIVIDQQSLLLIILSCASLFLDDTGTDMCTHGGRHVMGFTSRVLRRAQTCGIRNSTEIDRPPGREVGVRVKK